jgi:hypothetical protein
VRFPVFMRVGRQSYSGPRPEDVRRWVLGTVVVVSLFPGALAEDPGESAPTPTTGKPEILRVGPDREIRLPSQAAAVAGHGAVIEIDAADYAGDVAVWTQDDLVLRGVGGRPHVRAEGASAEGKAIWVVRGRRTTVENIEFSGARVADRNGAGIRLEGVGLNVSGCYFHDNENGILTGAAADSHVVIERSEFARNGHGDGQSHNIYVGRIGSFTLRFSHVHHARVGHNVKSRALENRILYSRIHDGEDGTSSFAIDLPEGGEATVMGNVVQQGPAAENSTIIAFGNESDGAGNPGRFYVVNNTIVNQRHNGIFIGNRTRKDARVYNNVFSGPGMLVSGHAMFAGNVVTRSFSWKDRLVNVFTGGRQVFDGLEEAGRNIVVSEPGFVDPASFDFSLDRESPLIDKGVRPGQSASRDLVPAWEYVHPLSARPRLVSGAIDPGAYEFSGE